MHADARDPVFESDLPLVRSAPPWPLRIAFGAMGVVLFVAPVWSWWDALWPPTVGSLFFFALLAGAASVCARIVGHAIVGPGDDWRYPPGTILIRRKAWRGTTTLRLTATNVAEVRILEPEDPKDTDAEWHVQVVPKTGFSQLAVATGPRGVFDAGGFASAAYAARVRQALRQHIGI